MPVGAEIHELTQLIVGLEVMNVLNSNQILLLTISSALRHAKSKLKQYTVKPIQSNNQGKVNSCPAQEKTRDLHCSAYGSSHPPACPCSGPQLWLYGEVKPHLQGMGHSRFRSVRRENKFVTTDRGFEGQKGTQP